jgi:hypothetical protein
MPAPTALQIKNNIKISLLLNGYWYKTYDADGNLIEDRTKLMPEMENIISAISDGINLTWITWQASQTVTGADTITGAPIIGILP